jgi:solute carrier organic anion transporter family, member 5A
MQRESDRLCLDEPMSKKCDTELELILPLVLIFFSQFIFGIGNTLFFALGQTYLDDGVEKKKNTPILLGYTLALRTFGPAIGFVLGFACLKIYIDPTKTPLVDSQDPRWMVNFHLQKKK